MRRALATKTRQPPRLRTVTAHLLDTRAASAELPAEWLAEFPKENPNPILACDRNGGIVFANDAALDMANNHRLTVPGLLAAGHRGLTTDAFSTEAPSCRAVEVAIGDRIVAWTYHPASGSGLVYLYGLDMTRQRRAERALLHRARHDGETGLPNRAHLADLIGHALERCPPSRNVTLCVVEVGRLKHVMDGLDRRMRSSFVAALTRRLRSCVGRTVPLARLATDMFGFLLEGVEAAEDAKEAAQKITTALKVPIRFDDGREIFTGGNVGIVMAPGGDAEAEQMLSDAGAALVRAKSSRTENHAFFDPEMHARAVTRIQLEADLQRAIERGELELHYQPIVNLETGNTEGFEALVRWSHVERGLVSPGVFIPLAEETGQVVAIGAFAVRRACEQLKEWQETLSEPPIWISVNLSAQEFFHPGLVHMVRDVLEQTQLDPGCLKLELTESAIMDDAVLVAERLAELHQLGVKLCIDDFGTGYSSLNYLHHFPVHTLKVDRSFVANMGAAGENSIISKAIIGLAHEMGMSVVAEGVETEAQAKALRAMNSDLVQGYFFARPMPRDGATRFLTERHSW